MEVSYWRDLLRPVFRGRKVVVTGAPVAGSAWLVRDLLELGAQKPFVLADSVGTGELPSEDEADWHSMELRAPDLISGVRIALKALADPPASACAALDRYDPDGEALVVGNFFYEGETVAGRRNYAPRQPRWRELEDKVVIDAFFERAGVDHAPSHIVPASAGALAKAARELDRGLGTAWAGDAKEGFNGGASYLRWVRDDAGDAASFFEEHSDRVRVMPFIEGVPCSIHGMVFEDDVIGLRPVEMVTLRRAGEGRLLYAGTATFWDPAPRDRQEMRAAAVKVGRRLRDEVDFRGAFTLDGVMTEDGFRPTEVNTRWGQGLGTIGRALPNLPLFLLNMAVIAGERFDLRPKDLEGLLIESADANRTTGIVTTIDVPKDQTVEHRLVEHDGRYRAARAAEEADAKLWVGPSTVGGLLRLELDAGRYETGLFVAAKAVAAFAMADRDLGTGIGPLEPARPVR